MPAPAQPDQLPHTTASSTVLMAYSVRERLLWWPPLPRATKLHVTRPASRETPNERRQKNLQSTTPNNGFSSTTPAFEEPLLWG